MKVRSMKLTLEKLDDRCVPATVAYADFNNDTLLDKAEITSPTTITVSLANPDGSYTVSAILTTPTKQPAEGLYSGDFDGDGDQDIAANGTAAGNKFYTHSWLGNGDGTFGSLTTSTGQLTPGHTRWAWGF
jgi:hypothetical protein